MNWKEAILLFVLVYIIYALAKRITGIEDISKSLPKHRSRKFQTRQLPEIEKIVVHHTGGNFKETPLSVAKYHIGPNHVCSEGCPGILYHVMIDRAGKSWKVNDLKTITWHLRGQNRKTVAICFIGNYDNYPPTEKQIKTFRKEVSRVNRKVGKKLEVTNHQKECSECTHCPGSQLIGKI